MKKSYIKCPYGCPGEISISGMKMHVKNKHTDKLEEFTKNFAELKKTAVVRDTGTKTEVPGKMPPKIEDPPEPPKETPKEPPKEPEKKKDGDGEPKKGGSFLREFNEWLDSPEF